MLGQAYFLGSRCFEGGDPMGEGYTIQQAAELTGLSAYTLRYYERIGLIGPVARTPGGHRQYTNEEVGWIKFLRRLRATGMPISQMLAFAELSQDGGSTFLERYQLLEKHREKIEQEIQDLQENLYVLKAKIQHFREKGEQLVEDCGKF